MKTPVSVLVIPSAAITLFSGIAWTAIVFTYAITNGYPSTWAWYGFGFGVLCGLYAFKWWPEKVASWTMPTPIAIPAPKVVDNRPAEAYWQKTGTSSGLYTSKVISEYHLRKIAHKTIVYGQDPTDTALKKDIGDKVSQWRDELMNRVNKLADWNSYNAEGYPNKTQGWHFTQDGIDMLTSKTTSTPPPAANVAPNVRRSLYGHTKGYTP